MQLIDTHTHLYLPEFDSDRDDMIGRAITCGVNKLLMPNIDIHSVGSMLSASDRYRDICYPMIGLHPTSVRKDYLCQIEELEKIAHEHEFIAVGEIGIDLYWNKTYLKEQKEAFRRQVRFAIISDLPVVIHSRESISEVFSILEEFSGEKLKGVFHVFSGTADDARKAIGIGFMLGIGGPLTFRNSNLDEIVREIGISSIVLETDSPYLAPVPHRGERNESSYISLINKKLADVMNMDEESTALITFENSCRLFNLSL
jgi:TatD DNase family protein